jgi:hypothetical protein
VFHLCYGQIFPGGLDIYCPVLVASIGWDEDL